MRAALSVTECIEAGATLHPPIIRDGDFEGLLGQTAPWHFDSGAGAAQFASCEALALL